MNILHVSTPATWRGGEQQAAYLAIALHAGNIRQAVLTPEGSELQRRLSTTGVTVLTYGHRGLSGVVLARRIASLCKRNGYDIVHAHDSHAHSAAVLSAVLFRNRTPVVVSRRVDFAVSASSLSRFKYNHHSVRKIICVSEVIRNITAPSLRNTDKLCVVHSGIDTSRYEGLSRDPFLRRELGLSDDTPLVGNLSALADHKDFATFLKTARRIADRLPEAHFIIAGSGPEETAIRQLIRSLQLETKVHLIGFRNDVPAVLKSLDVFLITSSTEGLGTIVLEAFAAGVPVVATSAGGIPELVEHRVTGLLAPVRDDAQLASNVLSVLSDALLRERLCFQAKEKLQRFTFGETARKTLKVYNDVLASD